ncbi:hypothetical protein ABW19_dt0209425 [Dactylella cylindrospora]|nr:hypothetical protein ABW19_dt0209425 [Dactylella cylindrospora]
MVKLGNEANPVPVLAPQPNPTSSPEGNIPTDYVPVPPLPTDYGTNANSSLYSNLAASQLAAYNEWIAIQAYYHYSALAHNIGILIQEERTRFQEQLANQYQQRGEDSDLGGFQNFNIGGDLTTTFSDATATQERESLLEEYSRQASIAQRAAAFHSTRHHVLLQEERSRIQDISPIGLQSSSSSSRSSSSPFSKQPSRGGTPSQPSSRSSNPLSPSSSQQSFPQPNQMTSSSSPSAFIMNNYLQQRNMADQNIRRGSYPFQNIPLQPNDRLSPFAFSPPVSGFPQYPAPNMNPTFFGYGEPQLMPSFHPQSPVHQYPFSPTTSSPVQNLPLQQHRATSSFQQPQHRSSYTSPHTGFSTVGSPRTVATTASIPPTPMFVTTSSGLPVNLSYGAVQTENRGIFIGNLPYNTHWRDLKTYLSPAGTIVRCDVPRKPNNKGRGYATVLFSSTEEANRACELFNGTTFQGRQIRVRLDTYANTKSVAAAEGTAGSGSAGSGSGGNQSSFFTEGDTEQEAVQKGDQGGRKSAASV